MRGLLFTVIIGPAGGFVNQYLYSFYLVCMTDLISQVDEKAFLL